MLFTNRLRWIFGDAPVVEETQPPGTMDLGRRLADGRRQYVPDGFNESHWWCMGATWSGKTARFIYPMLKQRMERNDGPVVIGDMKGEDWLFHAVKESTEQLGRRFLWLTNVPYFSTFLFNPLDQRAFDHLFVPQLAQVLLNALNLWHGFDYGRFYFGSQSRKALAAAFDFQATGQPHNAWMPTAASTRIRSFGELRERVVALVRRNEEYGGAEQLLTVLEDLANILQVNFTHNGRALPQTAVDSAIRVPDLLVPDANGKYPVVYLYLRAGMELVGVSQVMKLFVSTLFVACVQARDFYKLGRREHKPPIVPVFLDEWHNIADRSLKGIIETASGLGIQFIFANQDPSQLKTTDIDLSATVWENGRNKVIFTARDPSLQRSLMEISGEQTVYVPSYAVSHPAWKARRVTPQDALHVLNGQWAPINVAAQQIPRVDRNALVQMSTSSSQFLFVPAYAAPEVGLDGFPTLLNGRFAMSPDEYDMFQRHRWPKPTPETIVPADVVAQRNGQGPPAT